MAGAVATVHGRFLETASRFPDRTAIVHDVDGQETSYRELERRSAWVAQGLSSAGVQAGDLVGICLARTPDLLAAMLGILRAGAAYVPLDSTYPGERLDMVAVDAGMRAILADSQSCRALRLGRARAPVTELRHVPCLRIEELLAPGAPAWTAALDALASEGLRAYVIFTSGSTGRPKGVEVLHAGVVNLLESSAQKPGFLPGETLLALTTVSFDIHVLELFLPLTVGGKVVLLSAEESKDPVALDRAFRRHRPTLMQATPAQWRMLIDVGFEGHPNLNILIGGEALNRPMANALLERCSELWNAYGPTETTVWSSIGRVEREGPILLEGLVQKTQFHVLSPDFDPRSPMTLRALGRPGDVGELWIGGAGVALGYLGREELTRERFLSLPLGEKGEQERVYRTGDLVRRHVSGALEFLGRTDFLVKVRGFRVELGEIEAALDAAPEVRHAVVVATPDGRGENRLVAYVELKEAIHSDRTSALLTQLRAKLPSFMVPSHVVTLARMPLTPNGKIDRKALPPPPSSRPCLEIAWTPPVGPAEESVCRLFGEALGLDTVGALDSFFDLGGTSVMVTGMMKQLAAALGTPVELRAFLKNPTPRALAMLTLDSAPDGERDWQLARRDAFLTRGDLGEAVGETPVAGSDGRTIFLTGATGFVGTHLLCELLADPSVKAVIALIRAPDEVTALARLSTALDKFELQPRDWKKRISVVLGDISLPLLGLSPGTFERLADRADLILHNASQVNLLYPYAELRAANVEGTREVLRLATTGHIKPLQYVSTLDVFHSRLRPPAPPFGLKEDPIESPEGLERGYESSKWAAESLVLSAAREFGVPVTVARLGMVGGHSRTGVGQPDDELNRFLRTALQLKTLPRIDLSIRCIPVDLAANLLARLVLSRSERTASSEIFHLNPSLGLNLRELRRELGACLETPLTFVDPGPWFASVRANPSCALFPLVDLFAVGDASAGRNYLQVSSLGSDSFSTAKLDALLGAAGLTPLVFGRELLRRYLKYLLPAGQIDRTQTWAAAS